MVALKSPMTTWAKSARFGSARRRARRGAVTVLGSLLLVLFVLITVLVVNWGYLVSVNRGMQHLCSIMALAAAPELLDEHLLIDAQGAPLPNQAANREAAVRVAYQYRERNNQVVPGTQQVAAEDVVVQTGFVDDVTQCPLTLDPLPLEHNTVFVACTRTTDGAHPVRYPVDLSGTMKAVEIRGGACATLDNLVVGFRPESELAAPVVPLAIRTAAWASERTRDSNGNGILEITLRLKATSLPADPAEQQLPPEANAALLFFDGVLDEQAIVERLPRQIAQGLLPDDVLPGKEIGPATPARLWPVAAAEQVDDGGSGTAALAEALRGAVGQKRVFPLLRGFTAIDSHGAGTAQIEGFVACVVLEAAIVDGRLVVAVEPCFLIHHTAWTVAPNPDDPLDPARNLYVYKLRLSR
jgi:hypothetical protein